MEVANNIAIVEPSYWCSRYNLDTNSWDRVASSGGITINPADVTTGGSIVLNPDDVTITIGPGTYTPWRPSYPWPSTTVPINPIPVDPSDPRDERIRQLEERLRRIEEQQAAPAPTPEQAPTPAEQAPAENDLIDVDRFKRLESSKE